MITPYEDKLAIKAILDTDDYIRGAGFKPENIKMTKYGTDVLNTPSTDLRIFIYNGYQDYRMRGNQRSMTYNIAIVGKRVDSAPKVDNISQQVIALLSETDIGRGHILYLQDPPLELESDASLYMVELSFVCYESIYNKIQK